MRSHRNNNKIEIDSRLNAIDAQVNELFKKPSFLDAEELIINIVSLLGVQVPEKSKFGFILDQKFIKNEPWFLWHEIFPDKRAGEVLKHDEGMPIEIKIYWLNRIAADRIKGIVRFTDNYEDNKRTRDDEKSLIGADFIINPKADGIIIALSNNGIVRVLEIKERLNNTQKQILSSWAEIASGEKRFEKGYLHESLWNSFELKVVNQNFYDMISNAFTDLKQHLESKNIFAEDDAKQFSNRLIGRLLFVWFLRKKDFISEEKIPYFKTDDLNDEDYYKNRLEKLFFDTLNKPIELRDAFSDDLKTPYLNGGLFYRQKNDIPQGDFSFPKYFFTNLYRNLNEYNFTTDESTPDFEQVAIDPEMLGRVFENLLASMTTETGKQARKAKGAFYTPREIVQYMCRGAIRQFLYSSLNKEEFKADIDRLIDTPDYEWANNESNKVRDISKKGGFGEKIIKALEKMKTLDPACGSGAFPIGMLQALLRIYSRLNRTINEYEIKLKILENNIYGVDIEPMAVEISRLRAFLALVVDQEYNEKNKNGGIDTLPNLEFKFVCANTLLKLNKEGGLYDVQLKKGKKQVDLQEELTRIKKEYFKADWKKKKKLEEELDGKLKSVGLFESKKYEQLRSYHPIKQVSPASFYDPKLMHDVEDGFEIVIANPPYVSTKGVKAFDKKDLEKDYGFADDLYSHFYFKGIDLCVTRGVLSYITSKTFWIIQTKKNVRELLYKHNIIYIYDTANPFESAMVDTCVTIVQKNTEQENKINFLIGKEAMFESGKKQIDYMNPIKYSIDKNIYENAVNKVIFNPSPENLVIYTKYNNEIKKLLNKWWPIINTSKNITKHSKFLEENRACLKSGELTLLGIVTDGGQGLATGNNGKYLGVLHSAKEARDVRENRKVNFFKFLLNKKITKFGESKEAIGKYLENLSEMEIRKLFDSLKEKYGRDIFGKGFLYRIVSDEEVINVNSMTSEEKKNGVSGNRSFVPYSKGDKEGKRWYHMTPYYIDWNRKNVDFLKQDPNARYQGEEFYFRAGVSWNLTNGTRSKNDLKFKYIEASVNDVNGMRLCSNSNLISDKFLVCIGNSKFINNWSEQFINFTLAFQINDARQIPIIIPTKDQLADFEDLFDRAYAINVSQFDGKITNVVADQKLQEIQKELDKKVLKLYKLTSEEIKIFETNN